MSDQTAVENKHSLLTTIGGSILGVLVVLLALFLAYAVYTLLGASIAYLFMIAAGDIPSFDPTSGWAILAPIVTIAVTGTSVALYSLTKEKKNWIRFIIGTIPFFWIQLPILFNQFSGLCGTLGLTELDRTFYALRYHSWWLTPIVIFLFLQLLDAFERRRESKSAVKQPTSDDDTKLPSIF